MYVHVPCGADTLTRSLELEASRTKMLWYTLGVSVEYTFACVLRL